MKQHLISINSATCIMCGKCVKVCPAHLFTQRVAKEIPEVHSQGCIACGHCVSACPSSSVSHSEFAADHVHKIDYTTMPTADQVMQLCKVRRSNRAFSDKPVPDQALDLILEAAHRAPTASNMQGVEFTLITDPDNLRYLTDFTIDTFGSIVKKLTNPIIKLLLKPFLPGVYRYVPAFGRLISARDQGVDLILRGAKSVILIHTPNDSRFGAADANLAYQNGSLMAESLGVSQFYTGFVCSAIKQDKAGRLAKRFGITGAIHAGMALGMPSFRYPNYIDKKDIVVTKF